MMTQTVPRLSGSVLLGLLIAAIWFLADQVSKWWIINSVMRPPQVIPVTEFFNLVLGHNTGVSFGLFGDASPWMLIATTLAIVIGVVLRLMPSVDRLTSVSLGRSLGGAFGHPSP